MSYLFALFGTIAVYVLLGILLLSLNIVSMWRWYVKGAAIVVTTGAFVGAYVAIVSMLGWPSPQEVPDRFSLIGTRMIEPDKVSGANGHLYMWIEEVDERNLPIAAPRAYEVVYTEALANALFAAQQRLNQGEQVLGEMIDPPAEQETPEEQILPGTGSESAQNEDQPDIFRPSGDTGGIGGGDGFLMDITGKLRLSDMPPPELPDKPF